jgi:DNA end-binding protein Ku
MRAMWSGAVSFGLVSVPVKLYSATENHDVRFHQVHGADGGRIRYRRVCEVCGQEVDYADIVKGYETEDGELITLDDADLESLPVASGSREIDVVEFVPADQVDPIILDRSYYLEPEPKAAKPYALLREALRQTERMALVKVAIRTRETLGLLRVRDQVIVLQTMLWPDEVRVPDFEILDAEVELRPQEMQMASSLVDSLGADFDPTRFTDEYREAMLELIERKRGAGETQPVPAAAGTGEAGGGGMTDLLTALQRSVEAAKGGSGTGAPSVPSQRTGPEEDADTADSGSASPGSGSSGSGSSGSSSSGSSSSRSRSSGSRSSGSESSGSGSSGGTRTRARARGKAAPGTEATPEPTSEPKTRAAGKGTKRSRRTA